MDLPNTDRLNRRNFLQLTGGLALATFSTLLVGCGNPATTTPTAEATKALAWRRVMHPAAAGAAKRRLDL